MLLTVPTSSLINAQSLQVNPFTRKLHQVLITMSVFSGESERNKNLTDFVS